MQTQSRNHCITRVVIDGEQELELAALGAVMHRIRQALPQLPEPQLLYIANALFDLAVCRVLRGSPLLCDVRLLGRAP